MPLRIPLLFLFICFFNNRFYAQDRPVLIQQVGLDAISDAISDAGGNTLLVKSGENNYTLIDQVSKIQMGTVQVDIGSLGIPGHGLSYLHSSHRFLVSTGRVLLQHDYLIQKTDTVFRAVKFPEFIINYMPFPGDGNKLIIAVKKYPVDQKGEVHFEKADAKNERVFDDTRNCRLLVYDLPTRTVLRSVAVDFAVTVFYPVPGNYSSWLAGTFDGDILRIDTALNHTKLLHAFDVPVHSLALLEETILAVPHIAPKFLGTEGGGTLLLYNTGSREKKTIRLPEQVPVQEEDAVMKLLPSSQVKKVWAYPREKVFLVNYGFSRLLKLALPAMDTSHYPLEAVAAGFYCFNRDSTQLLAAASGEASVFGVSGSLFMYGLQQKKAISFFRKPAMQEKYSQIVKMYDRAGNYHIIALRREYSAPDSLVIYSSNRTRPAFLTAPQGTIFVQPEDTSLAIARSGWMIWGKLRLEKLTADNYRFFATRDPVESDSLHPGIFEIRFDTRKTKVEGFPYGLNTVKQLDPARLLIQGYGYEGSRTVYSILVTDNGGKILFRQAGLGSGWINDLVKPSPSGKYLALLRTKGSSEILELWDWQGNRKLLSHLFTGNNRMQHYCFDKTKDICWFAASRGNITMDIYRADPAAAPVKPRLQFSDPSFISFETDMARDRVAAESYNLLRLQRLSDRAILWENQPFSSGFDIRHLPDGFAWSSEKELQAVTNGNDHLHFTSFVPYRPVELLNRYLYRGEKQAVNNLAFVYGGKGFLPGDFDIYFNRPDSVLPRSGSANRDWNLAMRNTVAKRLRYYPVSDLNDVLGKGPRLLLRDREKIPDLLQAAELEIALEAGAAEGDTVKAVHVTANGVPVFGREGWKPEDPSASAFTLRLPLVKGLNKLQLQAESRRGLLSVPEYISVQAEFTAPPGRSWFIGIGVSRYNDTLMNLRYADKDIRDLASEFAKRYPGGHIDTLLNEQATAASIRAIRERLLRSSPEDQVVISFSGHGLVDSSGNFYFATHDMDFAQPAAKGLPYEEMEQLLSGIPARKRLLWIDACHSGELDKELLADSLLSGADASVKAYGAQRGGIVTAKGRGADLQNSFELMRTLFTEKENGSGAVVISASGGLEYALEDAQWQNGVFTYSVKKALLEKKADSNKDGRISINELREYVSASVEQLTGGRQKPTTRKELAEFDWEIW